LLGGWRGVLDSAHEEIERAVNLLVRSVCALVYNPEIASRAGSVAGRWHHIRRF
jgi:hypothetical protein